ncbi:hypothetical protein [Streptomyces sp. SP18CS02]|uniref:hypothetical protein n=1 Tax=Streptomyces sp. SP18CS02 TaxID=3002531 RepID=UPI002E780057|nr:hypothetical protein [Streptomyces sp. SP18CS02]MEE1752614.1 hypothetical protein [Streptomyces sp. SP18CS02]
MAAGTGRRRAAAAGTAGPFVMLGALLLAAAGLGARQGRDPGPPGGRASAAPGHPAAPGRAVSTRGAVTGVGRATGAGADSGERAAGRHPGAEPRTDPEASAHRM